MNWCVISVNRLRDYENRKRAVEIIPEQIKSLEYQFTGIKSAVSDGTPVQEETNRREENLIYNISKREELAYNLDIAKREVQLTEKGLAALTDDEQRILYLFFISRPKDYIQRLSDEMFLSKSEVYRKKDDALRKFTIAMYGVTDL